MFPNNPPKSPSKNSQDTSEHSEHSKPQTLQNSAQQSPHTSLPVIPQPSISPMNHGLVQTSPTHSTSSQTSDSNAPGKHPSSSTPSPTLTSSTPLISPTSTHSVSSHDTNTSTQHVMAYQPSSRATQSQPPQQTLVPTQCLRKSPIVSPGSTYRHIVLENEQNEPNQPRNEQPSREILAKADDFGHIQDNNRDSTVTPNISLNLENNVEQNSDQNIASLSGLQLSGVGEPDRSLVLLESDNSDGTTEINDKNEKNNGDETDDQQTFLQTPPQSSPDPTPTSQQTLDAIQDDHILALTRNDDNSGNNHGSNPVIGAQSQEKSQNSEQSEELTATTELDSSFTSTSQNDSNHHNSIESPTEQTHSPPQNSQFSQNSQNSHNSSQRSHNSSQNSQIYPPNFRPPKFFHKFPPGSFSEDSYLSDQHLSPNDRLRLRTNWRREKLKKEVKLLDFELIWLESKRLNQKKNFTPTLR